MENSKSIIKPKTLEIISRKIGDFDSGSNLVEFLKNCGVDEKLINSSDTKWRMVYSVLFALATSDKPQGHKLLFKIIEESVHPLTHGGDGATAEKLTKEFNNILKYDNFEINNGVLWQQTDLNDIWIDKDDNTHEPECYAIYPNVIDELYVFWYELIKLVKFYDKNKENIDSSLNELYFELIKEIENKIHSGKCGSLVKEYNRPFNNIIGCEYENNEPVNKILVNLYGFLGKITETDCPTKEGIAKVKEERKDLIGRIDKYILKNQLKPPVSPKNTEDNIQKIQLVSGSEIEIGGLRDGLKSIVQKGKEDNKPKFPYKLPAGTVWENFILKFVDDENIQIQVRQFQHIANYKDIVSYGKGKKIPKPSVLWDFLKVLAQLGGEISIKDKKRRNQYKKQKELLSECFRSYFSIDYDLFYPYYSAEGKESKSYKIKVTLIPLPEQSQDDEDEEKDDLGIAEEYKKQTPLVYEDN